MSYYSEQDSHIRDKVTVVLYFSNYAVIKSTKFITWMTKVDNSEKKIPDTTTLIHINQYNTEKQNFEKKIGDVDKKYQIRVV